MIKRKSYDSSLLTGGQIRAARALLRWSAQDLADRSRLGVATIRRAEALEGAVEMTPANAELVTRTLESAGIDFTNGDAPGVRLKAKRRGQAK
jgi:transcriptional regulator with XRE-family HTH domain